MKLKRIKNLTMNLTEKSAMIYVNLEILRPLIIMINKE